jgi:16S rRNA (guanine966-N2)-methyltransferase
MGLKAPIGTAKATRLEDKYMRVIAGTARSLPLKTPEGLDTRPTQDRIKETLFNIIQTEIPGCAFVDMFSGSGGIGIEALSRGAVKAYFIENAQKPLACIEQNLAFTKFTDRAIILKQDACAALMSIYEKHIDVIFMDPPYNQGHERRVLEVLRGMKYVDEDTLIIVEASLDTDFSYVEDMGFTLAREKKYKTNKHVFIRKNK